MSKSASEYIYRRRVVTEGNAEKATGMIGCFSDSRIVIPAIVIYPAAEVNRARALDGIID